MLITFECLVVMPIVTSLRMSVASSTQKPGNVFSRAMEKRPRDTGCMTLRRKGYSTVVMLNLMKVTRGVHTTRKLSAQVITNWLLTSPNMRLSKMSKMSNQLMTYYQEDLAEREASQIIMGGNRPTWPKHPLIFTTPMLATIKPNGE